MQTKLIVLAHTLATVSWLDIPAQQLLSVILLLVSHPASGRVSVVL